ncbi:LutC/YkgG family protein [Candidatus Laterigemmans baculatus]|uniref:LutC/YkgG family protein n=1 Tax=Candidatus Laterigemmans baculatus TaxID=2770505 RepID=UPI0013DC4EE7|nr:LUD domain-containing protein [Candidatus Laterigemmans baculatus]
MTDAASTSSRQAILDRLRSRPVTAPPLPDLHPAGLVAYDDPLAQFCQVATSVGAAVHRIGSLDEIGPILEELPPYRDARTRASLLPAAVPGNLDLASVDDPHDLASLDWLIAAGDFGVAENGAIWMRTAGVRHRASFFITQYLAIVISAADIVPHMHAAYERIGSTIEQGFGVFIAGPSKTADIEQSLVLGAHGCRALTIFVCGEA